MINWLLEPFQFPFMQTALIAAIMVGIPSAVIGSYVVLRRMAFIGNALSHTVLPGLVIAFMNNWSLPLGAMVAGILTSLGIGWLSKKREIRDDTAIGVTFTAMFALGLLLISTTDSLRDLNNMLFGNILGVTDEKLWIVAGIAIIVLLALAFFHKELELTSVDPVYAQVIGLNPDRMRFLLLILLALTVVSSIQVVGVVLTSAMLITPAASAGLLTKRLPLMMVIASFFAIASGIIGLYISYYADTSSGAAIVLASTGFFALSWLISVAPSWLPDNAREFMRSSKVKQKLPALPWKLSGVDKNFALALVPLLILLFVMIATVDFRTEPVPVATAESEASAVIAMPTALPTAPARALSIGISDTTQIFYLAPAYEIPRNIWMLDLDTGEDAQQVTDSESGVLDFAINPDRTRIAFSERNTDIGTFDIKLLNLETGAIRRLTDCQDADCITPVWHPNGEFLVYERIEFNVSTASGSHAGHNHGAGQAVPGLWFIDFSEPGNPTGRLFPDQQLETFGVQWSQDGNRLMMLDASMTGIFVYDYSSNDLQRFDTGIISGRATTTFSPDGRSIVYPKVVIEDGVTRMFLHQVSIDDNTILPVDEEDILADDDMPKWSPDGRYIAVSRRYPGEDERYTGTRQVYLIDTLSGDSYPLFFDSRYTNGFFEWSSDGTQLMILRFQEFLEDGELNPQWFPELWIYDLQSEELSQLAFDALNGRWTP